jgi:hypothetical protein
MRPKKNIGWKQLFKILKRFAGCKLWMAIEINSRVVAACRKMHNVIGIKKQ